MQADVLLAAEHFIMVTTVEVDYSPDQRDIENAAWDRLGAEYGIDWVGMTRQFIKNVSIEIFQEIPTVGDITDTGTEGDNND